MAPGPQEKETGSPSGSARGGILSIYARVFRVLLARWVPKVELLAEEDRARELDDLVLPSNRDWRHRVYYGLVELQRELDAETSGRTMDSRRILREDKWREWLPENRKYPVRTKRTSSRASAESLTIFSRIDGSMTEACIEPGWRLNDIVLAARVLRGANPRPTYADEAEARRVLGLVYDVLRYRKVLSHALSNARFWQRNDALRDQERVVWLLLYDLQGRKFARLGDEGALKMREEIFEAASLKKIEDALLQRKTRLAASVSRLRIGGSALSLDQLLPLHLRSAAGVTWGETAALASGFVNTVKLSRRREYIVEMSRLGLYPCLDCSDGELDEEHFAWDCLCPRMINLHENAREKLATSALVRDHRFVFLDRSLCLGAAVVALAIESGRLCGPVALTHPVAPRHTAYLACLLSDLKDAGRLMAFGTGERRCEYEEYLGKLGITLQQCRVYSERYASPPALTELDQATVVLATPASSYTGLRDVVDLAVARGGDSDLLESLTSEESEKRSRTLLSDQMSTLKYALTRPSVQLVIYEVHAVLPAETTEMVERVVEYANRLALEKHLQDGRPTVRRKNPRDLKSSKSSRSMRIGQDRKEPGEQIPEAPSDQDGVEPETKVPDSDLFEIGNIDDVCGRKISGLLHPGCFLAVIKRKEMTQLNSLFMIKEAEARGLFGEPNKQQSSPPPPTTTTTTMREEVASNRIPSRDSKRESLMRAKIEIDRIAAPTHAFAAKTTPTEVCVRHNERSLRRESSALTLVRETKRMEARKRWPEVIRFILGNRLRGTRSREKLRATRIDPFTRRTLYGPTTLRLLFPEEKGNAG